MIRWLIEPDQDTTVLRDLETGLDRLARNPRQKDPLGPGWDCIREHRQRRVFRHVIGDQQYYCKFFRPRLTTRIGRVRHCLRSTAARVTYWFQVLSQAGIPTVDLVAAGDIRLSRDWRPIPPFILTRSPTSLLTLEALMQSDDVSPDRLAELAAEVRARIRMAHEQVGIANLELKARNVLAHPRQGPIFLFDLDALERLVVFTRRAVDKDRLQAWNTQIDLLSRALELKSTSPC